jgi:hypothetical protein
MPIRFRDCVALLVALVSSAIASTGSAQDSGFAESGALVFGADRLFGVLHTSTTIGEDAAETTTSSTEISLLTRGAESASPYAAPRLTFDGFVTDGISLGGTLGVTSQSVEIDPPIGMDQDGPSETAVIVGGRIGYGHMFSDTVGLWPKLGLTYFTDSLEDRDGDEIDISGLAMSADVMLVIAPVPHFGFTIGPVLDLGLTGSSEIGPTDVDTTVTDVGLLAGLAGWL